MTQPESGYGLIRPVSASPGASAPQPSKRAWGDRFAILLTVVICSLHGLAIIIAMGGWSEISSDWPLLQADHGIHYHHGMLSRHFLRTTGTTAGYDPSFMSGYPMSIISDLSSTFSGLVMMASGSRPALGYKIHVLGCSALLPWMVGLAAISWRARPVAVLISVLLFLGYFWTDFPWNYAGLGMLNYLLSIPLGLLATAGLLAYLERGGFVRWLWAAVAGSSVFLVHLTSPMIVGPAGLLAYFVAVIKARKEGKPLSWSRHAGLWAIAPLILALNAFWWFPGYLLSSTKGESGIAFSHSSEGVFKRVFEIVWRASPPIEVVLLGLAPVGLVTLGRRAPIAAAGLGGFLMSGFGWGYLAAAFPALDSLQPGRHTYACYTAACVAAGIGLGEILARLSSSRGGRLDLWVSAGLLLLGVHLFGPSLQQMIKSNIIENSFLSSRPTPRILWVLKNVQKHVKPGERLLFEETGLSVAGLGDPYQFRHCSAILPNMAGVEVLGGPFLHTTVTTNFTQFGENKLFEKTDWDRDHFLRYARLYRPSAICCWSPKARAFCEANPDLINVIESDGALILGRVVGFEGAAIVGSAQVEAEPNRLVVRNAVAAEGDTGNGLVVLRYHAVPYLKAEPPVSIEPVFLEKDPVPFIGIRPTPGPVTIQMVLPPRTRPKS